MRNTTTQLTQSVKKLGAIAHEGRLLLLRELIQAGSAGRAAGALAKVAGVGASTVSAQLLVLANADLVESERDGRSIVYRANYSTLEGLLSFLMEDCCCAHPDICAPLASRLAGTCS